ncbi:MAG: hypothetical protein Q8Q03_00880 [bacterium]|nr:hypothetical protein [bacterium]
MKKIRIRKNAYALIYDVIIIAVGIAVALMLSRMGAIDYMINAFRDYSILATFIAGLFFTSAFTLAPAGIALVNIAERAPIHSVAVWGALGALCGDLILLYFIHDRFSRDVKKAFKASTIKKIASSFHFGFMKWLSPLLGALLIPSPLPDEFAMALLGASRLRISFLLPIIFTMNVVGIYLLIGFANLIS